MPRMQQIIETMEAERAELLERVVWLEKKLDEFRTQQAALAAAAPSSANGTTVVPPKRATRRGTAQRASTRRHAARDLKHDMGEEVIAFLRSHPQSTAGAVAKGLNADRTVIAARLATMAKAGEIAKARKGYVAKAD